MHEKTRIAHNRYNLLGKKFNKLTIIKLSERKIGRQCIWVCQCDCGKITEVRAHGIISGKTQSCGCLKKAPSIRYKGFEDLSGSYWWHIKYQADIRNLSFLISIEYAWNLFLSQNKKCALSGEEIFLVRNYRDKKVYQTASLDRIDSNKGYIEGNVQWLHKDVNNMKQHFLQEEFLMWCRKICANRGI